MIFIIMFSFMYSHWNFNKNYRFELATPHGVMISTNSVKSHVQCANIKKTIAILLHKNIKGAICLNWPPVKSILHTHRGQYITRV